MKKINGILENPIAGLGYPKNRFEHMVIRTVPGEDFYFAKLSGGKEYSLKYSLVLVNGTILEANEITREEYHNY
jgi:hypothetical protein